MTGDIQTNSNHSVASFDAQVRHAMRQVRIALSESLIEAGVDPTKPQKMARSLGLDKSLSWKVSHIVGDEDLLDAAAHLPGRPGLRILIEALERAGVRRESVDSLREAFDAFNRMVETHSGDRDTMEMMLGHLRRDGKRSHDEAMRKRAFQGNSAIWGVQSRVRLVSQIVAPARGSSDMLDIAIMTGLIDFWRLRPDVPWAVGTLRRYADDGSPLPYELSEPIDPGVPAHGPPLIREFCSDPLPPVRVVPGVNNTTRIEMVGGAVGQTASSTCITGWIVRNAFSRLRTPTESIGEYMGTLNTPAQLVIHDLFVHPEARLPMPLSVHLYSQLPGGPIYPNCGRNQGELRLPTTMIELGGGGGESPDLTTPEVPRYRQLMEMAAMRVGWPLGDFAGYRLKIPYPPIPTVTLFRHVLAEPD